MLVQSQLEEKKNFLRQIEDKYWSELESIQSSHQKQLNDLEQYLNQKDICLDLKSLEKKLLDKSLNVGSNSLNLDVLSESRKKEESEKKKQLDLIHTLETKIIDLNREKSEIE